MSDSEKKHIHSFQAEVKQVLDIVIHSLYTNREIFVRELISNAADALEKMRHEKLVNESIADKDLPLEIHIDVDEDAKHICISDSGVGMTEDEIQENLGTIAHSGTREFLKRLKEASSSNGGVQLIGQFGVGFYSAFMVSHEVTVETRSFKTDAHGMQWTSDGGGQYALTAKDGLARGTKITLSLRDDAHEFADVERLKDTVKKYSNFVPFPIQINGEKVNTIQALWTRNKNDITGEEYTEFYKFIANANDDPIFHMHFSADVPLMVNALLYVPATNMEMFGFGKMDPGVNLYCRKVLIQQESNVILPDWLRFVKGVVDSEDLPLNISRETLQDNALIRKLRKVITSRFIKFLGEQFKTNREKYSEFWKTFGLFLKQGAVEDFEYRQEIAPLLLFESSSTENGETASLSEYVSRMRAGQDKIFYINGPSREALQNGPYMEAFAKRGIEVLYLYEPIDDFVLSSLHEFEGKTLTSADQGDLDLPDAPEAEEPSEKTPSLSKDDGEILCGWMKGLLGDKVTAVRDSKRLVESPAMIVSSDSMMSASMQRVMQAMQKDMLPLGKHSLEINLKHPILIQLFQLKNQGGSESFLKMIVDHIYDNAMIEAGLMDDPRTMVKRNYDILEKAITAKEF
ncbi:MAG: molecular chaperone HtpG [Candidatus Omnitrophica bacterium]|nr:molecular chaperone HtpG [Candidatus Omnitrophota bacterium]